MKKISVSIVLILFILIGVIIYNIKRNNTSNIETPPSNSTNTESSEPEQFLKSVPDANVLKAGGSSFLDPKGVFVFLYPNDYKLDYQNNGQYIRIYKRGATQKGQTEIYDGILMVFESVDLKGKSIEDYTNSEISKLTTDGTTKIIEDKKKIFFKTYPGYTYSTKGFGEATQIILQKDVQSNYALSLTLSINDPQNKNYWDEVNTILSTIEILK